MEEGTLVEDHEDCVCGSGRTYVDCCKSGLGEYVRLSDGSIVDRRPLNLMAQDTVREAIHSFEQSFGSKSQSGDRLFTAQYLDLTASSLKVMLEVSESFGKPELAYAWRETGLILTKETYDLASPRDREDWDAAIDRFFELSDEGIDPFTGHSDVVRDLFNCLDEFRKDCAIHFGSYVQRHRRNRKLDLHEFSQVLVLSRANKICLMLQGKLGPFPSADALILIRSLFELYLTHEFLSDRPWAGAYLLSRSSEKDGNPFSYAKRASGKTDRSQVEFSVTGETFPAHVSYYRMAELSRFPEDAMIFDRIYARLSNEVHFSFENWQDYWKYEGEKTSASASPAEVSALFLTTVSLLANAVARSSTHTNLVRRDAKFLKRRATNSLFFLLGNIDEPPSDLFFDQDFLTKLVRRMKSD